MAVYILVIPIAKLTAEDIVYCKECGASYIKGSRAGCMYRMWRKFEVNYSIVYKVYKVKKLPATTVGSNL